ncbi:MAG: hydrogenase iron-sulfur subunit, partial [Euryarchaeota archaeon]|nr:hydrogenase iron-sulfur subunit [Euryarchaeota archaeon]
MVGAEKTGVFLCTCDKKLNINFKEIAGEIKNKVKFVEIVDKLCTPEGQGYIAQHLRWRDERRPEKLVIAACNTKTFDELLKKYEFDRENMILENIREHCAWVYKERNEATEKARAIVKCGVVKARYMKKPEPIKVTINRSIALVGSQGLATAPMLENFGASLHLIQSEGYLKRGFKAAKFNFYPASEVLDISGRLGNFKVTLKRKKYIDMQKCISCDACVAVCPKKAIYSPEDALFSSYAISEKCDKCEACIKVCQVDAVNLEEKTEEIKVGQVLYSSDCTAVLRAASNLTDRKRESLIRADLKKCANAGLKEKKLNITGCSYCNAACAYSAISYGDVDELSCVGCGICVSACPQGVLQMRSLPEEEMFSLIEAALDTELSPKILLFSCMEQDATLQAAGMRKIDCPSPATLFVPCIGMVSDVHILRAFDLGAEGVLLLGCKECMYGNGVSEAAKTAEFCRQLMGALGAEKERIKIIDGDADAPQKFAYAVSNFVRSLNSMPALGLG